MRHNFYVPHTFFKILLSSLFVTAGLLFIGFFVSQPVVAQSDALACIDVLPAGDIAAVISSSGGSAEPGTDLQLPMVVENLFPYPVHDASVFVAIYQDDQVLPYDWFILRDDVSLRVQERQEFNLVWNVPASTPIGTYTVAVYVDQATEEEFLAASIGGFNAKAVDQITIDGDGGPSAAFDTESLVMNGEVVAVNSLATFSDDAGVVTVEAVLANSYTAKPVLGELSYVVYEGLRPHANRVVQRQDSNARLVSGVRAEHTVQFTARDNDHYLVVGRFVADDGSRSSFLLPLERFGAVHSSDFSANVTHLGIRATDAGVTEVLGCVSFQPEDFRDGNEVVYIDSDVTYRLSLHPVAADGTLDHNSTLVSASGAASVFGRNAANFAFSHPLNVPDAQYFVRFELIEKDVVIATREVLYECRNSPGCEAVSESDLQSLTLFGVELESLILGMQLFTLVSLLIVIALFIYSVYSRTHTRRADGTEEDSNSHN